ncbi:DUF397 domain-containing protein [Streptomyces sp. NPDC046831]|uniref:DUF397 domain-containing protein n=1 Tax=Streptomyces sp. NPDC046831 TaxID=3154805 RepID=UPI0033C2FFA0
MDQRELPWRKSSYSMGNGGNCVEVAHAGDRVHVRDSKQSGGPCLTFAPGPWRAALAAAADEQ